MLIYVATEKIQKFQKLKFKSFYNLLTCTVLSVLPFKFFSRKSGKVFPKMYQGIVIIAFNDQSNIFGFP